MTAEKVICVYAASSENVDKNYKEDAYRLGQLVAGEGWIQVNGGSNGGLMGASTRGALDNGGVVDCVILERFVDFTDPTAYRNFKVTNTMAERKAGLTQNADAFIALPGGLGTLDELAEVMCMRQLSFHEKPIALVNTDGYYDGLIRFVRNGINCKFMTEQVTQAIGFANTPEEAIQFVKSYHPVVIDKDALSSGEMIAASRNV